MTRKVWQALGIAGAVLAAAMVAVYINPPTTIVNNRVAKALKQATGADTEVRGRPSFWFSPGLNVRVEDVTLLGPPEMGREPLVHAEAIEVAPALLTSLARWSLTFSSIRVHNPKLMLVQGQDGRANWSVLRAGSKGSEPGAMPSVGEIEIKGGIVSYKDARTGSEGRSDQIAARVTQLSPDTPIDVIFAALVKGQRVDGSARLPSPNTLQREAAGPARLALMAPAGRAVLDGTVTLSANPRMTARSTLDVPSLEALGRWLGADLSRLGAGAFSFAGDLTLQPAPSPPAVPVSAPASPTASAAAETIKVPDAAWQVLVRNGEVNVGQAGDRRPFKAEKVDASMTLASLSDPIEAAADFTVNQERIETQVLLKSPRALLPVDAKEAPRGRSPAVVRVLSNRGRLHLTGDILPGDAPAFHGRAKGETSNLRGLARALKIALPVEGGLETAEIDGEISASAAGIRIWNAQMLVDETRGKGELSVDLQSTRTVVGGKLTLDRLDAGRYDARLGQPVKAPAGPTGTGRQADDNDRTGDRLAPGGDLHKALFPETVSLTETLRNEVEGRRAAGRETPSRTRDGWSEQAIPQLQTIKAADLDVDLDVAIGELKLLGRTASVPRLKSVMSQGKLSIEGTDIASHSGKMQLSALIDTGPAVPTVQARLQAEGVEAQDVLQDLGAPPVLAGKAKVDANLVAAGRTEKALISSLKGRIETIAENSSVVGWDLRTSWRNIIDSFRRKLGMPAPDVAARTPVDRVAAVIDIEDGIAETREARVTGRYFSASADGKANLIERELESTGTFATYVAPEIQLPFKVNGPFDNLTRGIDASRIGFLQALSTLWRVGTSGGGAQESVGGGGDSKELEGLVRRYIDQVESRGPLSPTDSSAARELRRMLGPSG